MTLDEFAGHLQKAKRRTIRNCPGYSGCCPAHDDQDPSFAVWETPDGWLHVKCQKGCDEAAILGALGMAAEDRKVHSNGVVHKDQREVIYRYVDEAGKYLFEKVRYYKDGKKKFQQRIQKGDGTFLHYLESLGPKAKVLYCLPEVISAVKAGKTIYLNEGEKACESFRSRGLVATCQPGGADGTRPDAKWFPIHTNALRGARVVIVADQDETGEVYASYVAQQLRRSAKSVKIVQSKHVSDKADAFDHFAAGFGVEDFVERPDLGQVQFTQTWKSAAQIVVKKTEWLWEPYLPLGEVTLLAGDPGVGKSTLAQAFATATTLGAEVMGRRFAQGSVIFLSAEQSVSRVTVPRFHQMGADVSRIILPDDEGEEGEVHPYCLDYAGIDELAEVCFVHQPKLIVIDTITAYIEGARDMNSANQTREWIRKLADIARQHQLALVMLGHYNKNSQAKSIYRIVGSIDFVGASRSVLACGMDPDNKDNRAADHIKSNVGPLGMGIGFSIEAGEFRWTGASDLTAEKMFALPTIKEAKNKREDCARFIAEFMGGMPVDAAEIEKALKDAGFTEYIYKDVKAKAGIKSERDKFGDEGKWQWLPTTKGTNPEKWWSRD